jgi:hypothetical protein
MMNKTPDAWIVESKAGIWLTTKKEVAAKNAAKNGTIVTPYYSKAVEVTAPLLPPQDENCI